MSQFKKALVVGLGASGYTVVTYLVEEGWFVSVIDTRQSPPNLKKLSSEFPEVSFTGGNLSEFQLSDETMIVMSPGISPYFSEVAPIVAEAKKKGIPVVGEIELFARHLNQLRDRTGYSPKVIGITGTNGKTTTTMLTSHIIGESGHSVCFAGNVGPNALAELRRLEKAEALPEYWVLELSSFQLETTDSLNCTTAALLNITEDHIDWHGSLEAYALAKAKIFKEKTIRVLNRDDKTTFQYGSECDPSLIRSFGKGEPSAPGEFGLKNEGAFRWLAYEDMVGLTTEIIPENALLIRGMHNKMNALSACALCLSAGIEGDDLAPALRSYKGEPHRVQSVLISRGIEYVDDSKGTNVGATIAALEGFEGRKIVIILGGDGKGQDFSPIREPVQTHCRSVVLIGTDAPLIEKELASTGIPLFHANNMQEAVSLCRRQAEPGDVILLSPACASWDMFKDYADRSAQFIDCAKEIAISEGTLFC